MILLTSIKTLKERYLFDDNLEDAYIIPNIVKAQDFVIKPLIGAQKYAELLEQIEQDNVTADNEYLIDMIEPVIAYFVASEVVYSVAYKLKNKGMEDGADSSRFSELVSISKKYALDSQHYAQILGKYFERSCASEKPNGVYKTGLYLG